MRTQRLVLVVAALLLWGAVHGQPPSGGDKSRFGKSGGMPGGSSGGSPWGGGSPGGSSGRSFFGDPNEFFNKLSNGKEVILRSEITSTMMQVMFDRIAERAGITNGQVTREQFTNYMQQRAAERSGGAPPPGSATQPGAAPATGTGGGPSGWNPDLMADGMFRRYDQNGDGLLNFDELPESIRGERDKWDANRDGFIDLAEYKTYFNARVQQFQAERGRDGGGFPGWDMPVIPVPVEEEERRPVVYRAGKLPKELPSWFQQFDTDGDAQLGLYEWKNSGRSFDDFRNMDRNGDGFLTVEEVLRSKANPAKESVARTDSRPGLEKSESAPGGSSGGSRSSSGRSFGRGSGSSSR